VKLQVVIVEALPKVWLFVFMSTTIPVEVKAVSSADSSHAFVDEILSALLPAPFAVNAQFVICHIWPDAKSITFCPTPDADTATLSKYVRVRYVAPVESTAFAILIAPNDGSICDITILVSVRL
jgi:hypothetical protein